MLEDEQSSEEEIQQVEEEEEQGEQEEQIPYDELRFIYVENEVWYNSQRGAKVLMKKDVTPDVEEATISRPTLLNWDGRIFSTTQTFIMKNLSVNFMQMWRASDLFTLT